MANKLDELTGPINDDGQDVNVINKQLKIEVGGGSTFFQIFLWFLFIIPGLVFIIKKIGARNYFDKLEQRLQSAASEIDNYLEQRVMTLQNVATLVKKSIDLDKDTFTKIAALRSNHSIDDSNRNEISTSIDNLYRQVNVAIESYPELKGHETIMAAMQKNDYSQREITAARSNYNDLVSRWNQDVQIWPVKKIVAAKMELTTRIPFIASKATKEEARSNFFE